MKIMWCTGCGMEDTVMRSACPTCGSALKDSDVEWLEDGSHGEETVYELTTEPRERAAIVESLIGEKITHRWDNATDLVVGVGDEDATDKILDDILGEELEEYDPAEEGNSILDDEEDDDDEEDEEEGEGEDGYAVMSNLFLATTSVLKNWEDDDVTNFIFISGVALATPVPFGLDEEIWAEIQAGARNCSAALEIDSEADVEPQLKDLHALLQKLV